MIFFVGRFRHKGSKARRNTKVFAAEKRVKEVAQRLFFLWEGFATKALRHEETRRFLPQRFCVNNQ